MNNTIPKPARVEFGQVLRHQRESRSLTVRRVADMIGGSASDVEAYEAGRLVPEGRTWDKYKGIVNRRLPAYSDLRLKALAEYQAERALITQSMEQRKMVHSGTNGHGLTHKPLAAIASVRIPTSDSPAGAISGDARTVNPGQPVTYHNPPPAPIPAPAPPPAKDTAVVAYDAARAQRTGDAMTKLPKGWKSTEQIIKRRAFALEAIRRRPSIRAKGADSLHEMLVQTFGVGLGSDIVTEIREQVRRELECEHEPKREPLKPTPAAVQAAIDTGKNPSPAAREILAASAPPTKRQAIPTLATDPAENIAAAVSLVLEAVPNLRTFTITVDDTGEASVDYTMREVKVIETGGSMKVRR